MESLSPASLRIVAAVAAVAGSSAVGLAYANRHSAPLDAGLPRRVVLPPELIGMATGLAIRRVAVDEDDVVVDAPAAPPVPEDPALRLPLWVASAVGLVSSAFGGALAYATLIRRAGTPGVTAGSAVGLGLAGAAVAVVAAAACVPLTARFVRGPLPDLWEVVEYDRAASRRADYAKSIEKYRALVGRLEGLRLSPVDTATMFANYAARVGDDLRVRYYRRGGATAPRYVAYAAFGNGPDADPHAGATNARSSDPACDCYGCSANEGCEYGCGVPATSDRGASLVADGTCGDPGCRECGHGDASDDSDGVIDDDENVEIGNEARYAPAGSSAGGPAGALSSAVASLDRDPSPGSAGGPDNAPIILPRREPSIGPVVMGWLGVRRP